VRRCLRFIRPGCGVLVAALLLSTCGSGETLGRRTVFVDFAHDEFSTLFLRNFPDRIEVHPGDEIVFQQAWTGTPHTVTGGTLANAIGDAMEPLIRSLRAGNTLPQEEPPAGLIKAIERVGEAHVDEDFTSTLARPCYLTSGEPRKDGKPCKQRVQPEFNGRQALHNSGVIRYDGPGGNEHRVRLSDDIAPGKYFFYCAVHGPTQFTEVHVKDKDVRVPSAGDTVRAARQQVQQAAKPLLAVYRKAKSGKGVDVDGDTVVGPYAGLYTPDVFRAQVNEFVPKKISVRAGERVDWKVFGGHTISFNVPRYFAFMEFSKDGTVHVDPRVPRAAGGAPDLPRAGGSKLQDHRVDAGTWNGKGFWSSGEIYAEPFVEYSLRVSRPGTYRYACLIHPAMVGTLVVRSAT
jgi:plastocyanin